MKAKHKLLLTMILLLLSPAEIFSNSNIYASDWLLKAGSTDVTLQVPFYDATTGALKTSVTITDLDVWYIRVETDEDVIISAKEDLTSLGSLTAAHTNDGGYEIGHGYYRIDINDLALASGATTCSIVIEDAESSTILPATIDIQLTDYNPYATIGGIEANLASLDVTADVNSSIAAYNLDHLMAVAVSDVNDMSPEVVDGSVLSYLLSGGDADDWDYTTDSLLNIYDRIKWGYRSRY